MSGRNAGRIFTNLICRHSCPTLVLILRPNYLKRQIDTISTINEQLGEIHGDPKYLNLISSQFLKNPPISLNRLCHGSSSGKEGSVKGAHTEEPPDPRRSQINTEIPVLGILVLFRESNRSLVSLKLQTLKFSKKGYVIR